MATLRKLVDSDGGAGRGGRSSELLLPRRNERQVIKSLVTPDLLDALFANPPTGSGEVVVVPASPNGKDFLTENMVVNPTAEQVAKWLRDGYRLQIRRLETSLPEAWALSKYISDAISRPGAERRVGVNIFIVPPSDVQTAEPGARNHWDMAPMIMVQCFGSRQWRLGDPAAHPGPFDRDRTAAFYQDLDRELDARRQVVELGPGEVLYVPEGTLHMANQSLTTAAHLRIICYFPDDHDLAYQFPELPPASPLSPYGPGEGPIARAIAELDAHISPDYSHTSGGSYVGHAL